MPAEQDAARGRQLEALRRHMAHPDTGWEPPTEVGLLGNVPGSTSPDRAAAAALSRLLFIGLLVTLALVGGVVVGAAAWSDDRPARAPGTTTVAPVATPACKTAVDRANAMLASAVRLREALAEHGRILRPRQPWALRRRGARAARPVAADRVQRVGQVRQRPGRLPPGPGPVRPALTLSRFRTGPGRGRRDGLGGDDGAGGQGRRGHRHRDPGGGPGDRPRPGRSGPGREPRRRAGLPGRPDRLRPQHPAGAGVPGRRRHHPDRGRGTLPGERRGPGRDRAHPDVPSFSLEVEIDGTWPWQRAAASQAGAISPEPDRR